MRFLHTSDWQLGKPFGRVPEEARAALHEGRLDAIDTLAATARREGAEWIVVAGDVFDSPEPGDRVYRQALTRMRAADDVRWALLPGNHDPARTDGLWSRLVGEAPANVVACLEPEGFELSDGAWLLPAPLQYKRTFEDPTAWFDTASTPAGALRIGMAHGPVVDFTSSGGAANLVAPDRAKRAGLTYLALGDWHGRRAIDAFTHYSGTPEPDDFGRENTGVALLVDARAAESAPEVKELPIGRYTWLTEEWMVSQPEDISPRIAGLALGIERRHLVARLKIAGLLTLAGRVNVRDRLENGLAHEIRWLDLNLADLYARPTEHDLSDIDANGVLREAAEKLQSMAAENDATGRRAAAALERLYVEHQRAQRTAASA